MASLRSSASTSACSSLCRTLRSAPSYSRSIHSTSRLLNKNQVYEDVRGKPERPEKYGFSSMGLPKKPPHIKKKELAEGSKYETKPVLKGGKLTESKMRALISLYHSTRTHITRENLDAYIDKEFTSADGPRIPKYMTSSDLFLAADNVLTGSPSRGLGKDKQDRAVALSAFTLRGRSVGDDLGLDEWEKTLSERELGVVNAIYGGDYGRYPGLEILLDEIEQMEEEEGKLEPVATGQEASNKTIN